MSEKIEHDWQGDEEKSVAYSRLFKSHNVYSENVIRKDVPWIVSTFKKCNLFRLDFTLLFM